MASDPSSSKDPNSKGASTTTNDHISSAGTSSGPIASGSGSITNRIPDLNGQSDSRMEREPSEDSAGMMPSSYSNATTSFGGGFPSSRRVTERNGSTSTSTSTGTSTSETDSVLGSESEEEVPGLGLVLGSGSRSPGHTQGVTRRGTLISTSNLPTKSLSPPSVLLGSPNGGRRDTLLSNTLPEAIPRSTILTPSRSQGRKLGKRSVIPGSTEDEREGATLGRRESGSGVGHVEAGVKRSISSAGEAEMPSKNKGKGRIRPESMSSSSRDYNSSSTNDPLDPLSSLRPLSYAPSISASHRPRTSSSNRNLYQPMSIPAASPNAYASSSSASSSRSGPSVGHPPPQSLQQLLQTVDLSAALKLVQTLQEQQKQVAKPSIPLPSPSVSTTSNLPPIPDATLVNHGTSADRSESFHGRDRTSTLSDQTNALSFATSSEFKTPLLQQQNSTNTSPSTSPTKVRVSIASTSTGDQLRPLSIASTSIGGLASAPGSDKKDRRRSLSLSIGGGIGRKFRSASSAVNGSALVLKGDGITKIKERVPDERATLSEGGRGFEDQISRVHLNLSPATMRRAQNCSKYLSLRYQPIYQALSTKSAPPNPIAVSRWRDAKEEEERRYRRARVGTSGRAGGMAALETGVGGPRSGPLSENGSSANGKVTGTRFNALCASSPVYGARRNKHPKAWEIYPDEIEEFVAVEGIVQTAGGKDKVQDEIKSQFGTDDVRRTDSRSTSNGSIPPQTPSNPPLASSAQLSRARSISQTAANIMPNFITPPETPGFLLPSRSRHASGESSPLARSAHDQLTPMSALPPPPPLHRADSQGSSSVASTGRKSGFTALAAMNSVQSTGYSMSNGSANGNGSVYGGRGNHSPRPSQDFGVMTAPSSPRGEVGGNGVATPTASIGKHSEGGLRSNLTQRLNKIRGKGVEIESASDTGLRNGGAVLTRLRRGSATSDLANSPEPSDMDVRAAGRALAEAGANTPNGSTSSFRRIKGSRHDTSGDGGYRSSGAEDGSRIVGGRRMVKKWSSAWQGFNRGPLEGEMFSLEEGVGIGADGKREGTRIMRNIESDDEVDVAIREVLDLGDEDFAMLNGVLRQLRGQIDYVDAFLPRVPQAIGHYIEEIKQHKKATMDSVNITVDYTTPRLSASVYSQIATASPQLLGIPLVTSDTHTTTEGSSSESSESEESEDDDGPEGLDLARSKSRSSSVRFRSPKSSFSSQRGNGHSRRVTDPIHQALVTRARSQTLALPSTMPRGGALRALTHPTGERVDRLILLEKAIEDFEKSRKEIHEDSERLRTYQEGVSKQIEEVTSRVTRTQTEIDSSHLPKLQMLEDHFQRLRSALTRPSPGVDFFWAGLLQRDISEEATLYPRSGSTGMMLPTIRRVVIASARPSHLPSSTIFYQHSRTFSSSRPTFQPPANATPQALLAYYSQRTPKAVTLPELTKYGAPPLNQTELLEAAENTRKELLCGLARRVTAHLSLPFLPATNPSLQSIYSLYSAAFFDMVSVPPIKNLEDNDRLCEVVTKMVEAHRDNIPVLAKGFQESRKYLPASVITSFLNRAIRNRITLRLIAEQHLSLSAASLPRLRESAPRSPRSPSFKDPRIEPSARATSLSSLAAPTRIGVLDLALSPGDMVKACANYVSELCEATYGVAPSYRIEGSGALMRIGGIGVHLEYILTELLKNAFRATVEYHTPKKEERDEDVFTFDDLPSAHLDKSDFPEVVITIGVVAGVLSIRIRDRGGGIAPDNIANVFSYAFTTVPLLPDPDSDPDSPGSELYGGAGGAGYYGGVGGGPQGGESSLKTGMGTLAGLGFGLPLSRLYAGYFGGSLDLVSMYGWGTDCYVVLRTVEAGEGEGAIKE